MANIKEEISVKNVADSKTNIKRFICDICKKSFGAERYLRIHNTVHSGEKPFKCNQCGKCFTQNTSLEKHQRRFVDRKCAENEKRTLLKNEENLLECKTCGKHFIKSWQFRMHERIHTGEKPYQCVICSKQFARKHSLIRHQKIHTDPKLHECESCGKGFSQKGSLMKHERSIHKGMKLKSYLCEFCDKTFASFYNFQIHNNIHTGRKPYSCKHCEKTFAKKSTLITHERIHSKEKLFECNTCGKGFYEQGSLKST